MLHYITLLDSLIKEKILTSLGAAKCFIDLWAQCMFSLTILWSWPSILAPNLVSPVKRKDQSSVTLAHCLWSILHGKVDEPSLGRSGWDALWSLPTVSCKTQESIAQCDRRPLFKTKLRLWGSSTLFTMNLIVGEKKMFRMNQPCGDDAILLLLLHLRKARWLFKINVPCSAEYNPHQMGKICIMVSQCPWLYTPVTLMIPSDFAWDVHPYNEYWNDVLGNGPCGYQYQCSALVLPDLWSMVFLWILLFLAGSAKAGKC